jgi:2-dehydro-3-deoxyphosphooctonate aldolase (KDO 8-P synthase)
MTMHPVVIGSMTVGAGHPLALIGGPCAIEGESFMLDVASRLRDIAAKAGVPFIFKSSYDKANRTSIRSYRGPGLSEGLEILQKIKDIVGVPVLSDVHTVEEVESAAEVLDVLQIPAFLCRQTDLVVAAARTGKPVNVKKGQFLAPWDTKNIVEKVRSVGNDQVLLTERGASFGYNNLVADMRSLVVMRSFGVPVVFDATHSVQLPGGAGTASGGQREFVPYLARAAVATGCDALFMEIHPDPDQAPSDGPNMLRLEDLPVLLTQITQIDRLVRGA